MKDISADASKRSAKWIWATFAVLYSVQGVIVAAAAPSPSGASPFLMVLFGVSFGFLFGAVSALAIWTALETTRYRILISLICNFGITAAFTVFVMRTNGPWLVIITSWTTLLFLNLVIQGPLWFLRIRSGYEFRSKDEKQPSDEKRAQFSIGNMLALTTVVAIIIAAGKPLLLLVQENSSAGGNQQYSWTLLFLIFSLGATTTTLGSLWFMSARKALPLIIATMVWIGFNVISIYQMQSLGPGAISDACILCITCNVVAAGMVCVPLLILDVKGRRLSAAS